VARFGVFDAWFRPKAFESEHLYEALGALILKRYVQQVVPYYYYYCHYSSPSPGSPVAPMGDLKPPFALSL
jgi:hypothetical protein